MAVNDIEITELNQNDGFKGWYSDMCNDAMNYEATNYNQSTEPTERQCDDDDKGCCAVSQIELVRSSQSVDESDNNQSSLWLVDDGVWPNEEESDFPSIVPSILDPLNLTLQSSKNEETYSPLDILQGSEETNTPPESLSAKITTQSTPTIRTETVTPPGNKIVNMNSNSRNFTTKSEK